MITFTPLSGGGQRTNTSPLSYLLQVDDVRILLDCGSPDWCPEGMSSLENGSAPWDSYCKSLKECAPSIDLVLLSHGDLPHSGLFAYAYAHWGLRAPAYSSLPVQAMAKIAVQEDIESIRHQEATDEPTPSEETKEPAVQNKKYIASLKDVFEAFEAMNTLRFSQPTHLQGKSSLGETEGKCQGLTITAFNAGHTLGGTIWKIRSPSAGTILYAVDLNHLRERHLDGTILLRGPSAGSAFETLARPDLLITDADRVSNLSCRRKDRDMQLIDTVTSTLSSRHSVLMPCDASTRVLELLVLLDQHWSYSRLKYPICLISKTGRDMLAFVRSMMEWLGGTINKEDVGDEGDKKTGMKRKRDDENEEDAIGAFSLRFKHLEFFTTPGALLHTYSSKDPKLILAVPMSLSHGPSRIIFSEFACIPDNVVLLTSRGEEGTLGRTLFDIWNGQQRDDDKWEKGRLGRNVMLDEVRTLTMKSKVPLQGQELEDFLQKKRAEEEKAAAEEAALQRTQLMLEADEDDDSESDESDDENAVEDSLIDDAMDVSGDGDLPFAEPGAGTGRRRKRAAADYGDWDFETEDGGTKQIISFDIYLKGNVSKQPSFFKSEGMQQPRFRMFPYIERKRRVDEYGEVVDVGMWLQKGKKLEEEAESEEAKEARLKKASEEEAKKAPVEPPSKFISTEIEVQLACRLLFVDMEGVNDGRAVKKIAAQLNPRKMIIVHASAEGSSALTEACGAVRSLTKEIYAPDVGESIQIGQHTNSYSISLAEDLLTSLRMSRFEDNEVAYVIGCIANHAGSIIPVLEPLTNVQEDANIQVQPESEPTPDLLQLPKQLGSRPITRLPQSTMIGDLKLTSLKARLSSAGVQAEFAGEGVLLCRNKDSASENESSLVSVKKLADGKVELEGSISDVYYSVRKAIYDLHALVAA
ncbi:cleavage and polyadenylation specificity factor subunit [Schizopora paradoxa]|uniref:Cleavage and polyadenylation specificity factor subunit 2 n=1 Tax=Schizopora paradoxa TaxID=27342 RepID=A0A0H2S8S5_9AGAM|nr:cleavage and polyadenylation specificity factor subunit [Schizopora paradoxa]